MTDIADTAETSDEISQIMDEYRARSLAEGGGLYAIAYALLVCRSEQAAIVESLDYIGNMLGDVCAAVS
jgi:hypothetical protein